MEEKGFKLHKWHSNIQTLESQLDQEEATPQDQDNLRVVLKESTPASTSKILGVLWEKKSDALQVNFKPCLQIESSLTKRKMFAAINGVYDVLGWHHQSPSSGKYYSVKCVYERSPGMTQHLLTFQDDGICGSKSYTSATLSPRLVVL